MKSLLFGILNQKYSKSQNGCSYGQKCAVPKDMEDPVDILATKTDILAFLSASFPAGFIGLFINEFIAIVDFI